LKRIFFNILNLISAPIKFVIFAAIFLVIELPGCKKANYSNKFIVVNNSLAGSFNYKPGAYWIYKDSVSGVIDSAFVDSNYTDTGYAGCSAYPGITTYQQFKISIKIQGLNPLNTESWKVTLMDSAFIFTAFNNQDPTESALAIPLFNFPFITGYVPLSLACIPPLDSGYIAGILPTFISDTSSFINVALVPHAASNAPLQVYNDLYYVSPDAGLVKIVFNHPEYGIYRVLELQRYNIVK